MPDLRDEFEAWKRTMNDGFDAWDTVLWATERAAKKEREKCAKTCLALKAPDLDHAPGEYHRFDITTLACAAAIRARDGKGATE